MSLCAFCSGQLDIHAPIVEMTDESFNRHLMEECRNLRLFYQVNCSCDLIDDSMDGPLGNAIAVPTPSIALMPDGTVRIGINLLQAEYRLNPSGVTIPYILAHEFAHIYAVKWRIPSAILNYTPIRNELFADFCAGMYLGKKEFIFGEDVESVMISFFNRGAFSLTHPTPNARVAALMSGYNTIMDFLANGIAVLTPDLVVRNFLAAGF